MLHLLAKFGDRDVPSRGRARKRRMMASIDKPPSQRKTEPDEDRNPSLETIQNDAVFVERFKILYNSEVFSDIILRVGNESFYAHKFMLITCSEVFEAMLNEERWRESRQPEITLTEEVECVPVFSLFLKFIYTGSVTLTTENVLPVLLLADKYSMPILRQVCVEYMTCHIVESPDTNRTLSWYQYSKMTGNTELMDKCSKFILSNMDIILKAPDWIELTKGEIMDFLSSSDVMVHSEFELWVKLEKWLKSENNVGDLQTNLADTIPLLRFTMIPPKHLLQIEQSELCQANLAVFSDKLHTAYRHQSLLFDQVKMNTGRELFRNYTSDIYGLCNDLSLLNYLSVGKIDSKMTRQFSVPLQFVSQKGQNKTNQSVMFEVSFWPKGYYTTFNLYGNHMARQSDNTTFFVRRLTSQLPDMETRITLIIYGINNGIRYVAFTFTTSHTFKEANNTFTKENIIPMKSLTSENTPYLINGNLDAKVFVKVMGMAESAAKQGE